MPINTLMSEEATKLSYDQTYRRMLETHLPLLRKAGSTLSQLVEPYEAYRYQGDLYGYLSHKRVPRELHWLIMRLNDFNAPTDFHSEVRFLLAPSPDIISQIRTTYMTIEKKMS